MLQVSILDCELFDPFPFFKNVLSSSEVDIGRREIVQVLLQVLVVISFNEGGDLRIKLSRKIIIVQKNPVLQRLMPPLDLPLCLGMIRRATDMLEFSVIQPFRQGRRDAGSAI
jgi:hypothetical protein